MPNSTLFPRRTGNYCCLQSVPLHPLHLPHGLVAADVADLQAQGLPLAGDGAVPEVLGLHAVADDVAQLACCPFE